MKKNKYDLVEDIAWMLLKLDTCERCIMNKECQKFSSEHEERVLCSNVVELTEAIEKKYLR